ncbi:hypothetical protein Nepgr_032578 [Nepenthes gracilis]|uniref:High mobility group B protein 9 n=1 Tax=Nepenthes gracilis TaxID=150966 RepID=A0AAD3Y7S8_NEPGR|nr:hypothetical protein Nepgr_032578 [Nepenthes gracilis]
MSMAAGNRPEIMCYPASVVTHEEVVEQPGLFWETLKSLHSMLGTKFMVPVIGRKELDLHLLYVEVTRRGGYDKVVMEKKWREIGSVFMFSPTTTSASYVLRKHYNTLLYRYEQVYFFKIRGPLFTPTVTMWASAKSHDFFDGFFRTVTTVSAPMPLGQYICGPDIAGHDEYSSNRAADFSNSSVGGTFSFLAVGTIDGKFDCGYLVSVKLGSDILYGVLYHPEEHPVSCMADAELSTAIVPYDPKPRRPGQRRKRRRRWGGDPSHPKPNRSGYNFFFAEKHSLLKSLYPNTDRKFTKIIGDSWNNLGPEERMVYQNIGLRDKERYMRELREYKEKLKTKRQEEDAMMETSRASGC